MATPEERSQEAAEKAQHSDGNPVIENKKGKADKGNMKKLRIMIVALVVLIAGGLTLGLAYFKGARLVFEQQEEDSEKMPVERPSHEVKPVVKTTFSLEPFLVNLADKDSVRFVKTSFQLGLAEEPEEKNVEKVVPAIRNAIITLLSAKTAEQILTPQGKDKLREQVRTRVNAVSPGMEVVEVYIVDFVVQL